MTRRRPERLKAPVNVLLRIPGQDARWMADFVDGASSRAMATIWGVTYSCASKRLQLLKASGLVRWVSAAHGWRRV